MTESQPKPHEPNGDRWIKLEQGRLIYIVREKDKEYPAGLSAGTFFGTNEHIERGIEAMLKELNKDFKTI